MAASALVFAAGCGSSISVTGGGGNTTATTTSLKASPTALSTTGNNSSTTLTSVVTSSAGATFGNPTGSVTFAVGSTSLGSATLTPDTTDQVSSTATYVVPASSFPNQTTANSANSVIASYGGDDFHTSSNSSPVTVTVNGSGTNPTGIATTTSASATPASLASTASTTLSATVSVNTGTTAPTGQVAFIDKTNGVTLANATLIAQQATACGSSTACSTATAVVSGTVFASGANTVYATYPGDTAGVFATSTSPTFTVTVSGGSSGGNSTTTTVTASPATFPFGSCTNLTIQVAGQQTSTSTAPTGAVNLFVNGQSLGSATVSGYGGVSNSTYTACSNTGTALGASGNYVLIGTYVGDSNYETSSSQPTALTVSGSQKALTSLALSVTGASTVKLGSCTNVTSTASAQAKPNNDEPTGTVVFYLNGNTQIGTQQLTTGTNGSQAEQAVCTGTGQAITSTGTYTITSTYDGDVNYNAANSNAVSIVVTN